MAPSSRRVGSGPTAADLAVLAAWAPELADTFVALSCDIALVLDPAGRIVKVAHRDADRLSRQTWVGNDWAVTVSNDSLNKVEQMLVDLASTGHARRREINHPDGRGGTVPVAYSAVRLGVDGPTLAVGHDLSAQSAMQQRFVDAQLALERSYWQTTSRPDPTGRRPLLDDELEGDDDAAQRNEDRDEGGDETARSSNVEAEADREFLDLTLTRALHRLVDRVGQRDGATLLSDVRKLAEQHFLALAIERAGSEEALAESLGLNRRALTRRLRP